MRKRIPADEFEQRIAELKASPYGDMTPSEAAPLLGCDPYSLNVAAKQGMMGTLDYFFAGNGLRIGKASVLKFLGR